MSLGGFRALKKTLARGSGSSLLCFEVWGKSPPFKLATCTYERPVKSAHARSNTWGGGTGPPLTGVIDQGRGSKVAWGVDARRSL